MALHAQVESLESEVKSLTRERDDFIRSESDQPSDPRDITEMKDTLVELREQNRKLQAGSDQLLKERRHVLVALLGIIIWVSILLVYATYPK